jgi:RHS repeat-associated protein
MGSRTVITEADGTVRAYTYDGLYRLTRDKVTVNDLLQYDKTFGYDPVGNRLSQTTAGAGAPGTPTAPGSISYGYDARDRLLTENATAYGYDDNGSLVSKSAEATYTWDFENRLVKVTKTDGTVVEHVYDADGNRVQTKTTPSGGSTATTSFLVDTSGPLSQVVEETDSAGALKAHYVRGDDLLAVMRSTGPDTWTTRFYHADGLGSVRRLTDETGNVTDGYSYSAFGELLAHTGNDPQPYAFAGEPYDPKLGLQYHRARWMDPRVGRFTGMDPLGPSRHDSRTLHRYAYVSGDPVNSIDPTGKEGEGGLAGALVTVGIALTGFAIAGVSFGLYAGGYFSQGNAEVPPHFSDSRLITNYTAVDIADSKLSEDDIFDWMASFKGGNTPESTATLTGAGSGASVSWHINNLPQADFRVKVKNFSSTELFLSAVPLQGHPVRGYRYWRVWRLGVGNHMIVETAAVETPGPLPLDFIKMMHPNAFKLWADYMTNAVSASGGTETSGDDPIVDSARQTILGYPLGDVLRFAAPR